MKEIEIQIQNDDNKMIENPMEDWKEVTEENDDIKEIKIPLQKDLNEIEISIQNDDIKDIAIKK